MVVTGLVVAALVLIAAQPALAYCEDPADVVNVNGDGFFNKCFMDVPARFGTVLAKNVASYIAPNQSATIVFFMIVLLPFWYFSGSFSLESVGVSGAMSKKIRASTLR